MGTRSRPGAHQKDSGTLLSRLLSWPSIRSGVLFIGGALGVLKEEFRNAPVRWELLVLYAAMMGLPWPLGADAKKTEPPPPPTVPPVPEPPQRLPEGE